MSKLAVDFAKKLPDGIKYEVPENETLSSLHVFRNQQIDKFNKLLKVMKNSLHELKRAIDG